MTNQKTIPFHKKLAVFLIILIIISSSAILLSIHQPHDEDECGYRIEVMMNFRPHAEGQWSGDWKLPENYTYNLRILKNLFLNDNFGYLWEDIDVHPNDPNPTFEGDGWGVDIHLSINGFYIRHPLLPGDYIIWAWIQFDIDELVSYQIHERFF